MGLFSKNKKKQEHEPKKEQVVFETVGSQENFSLENQDGKLAGARKPNIKSYLENMFTTPGQFVILTSPRTQHKVRYIQACMREGMPHVELGIEEDGLRLYYKSCTQEECVQIFYDFFDNRLIPDMQEYRPLEF